MLQREARRADGPVGRDLRAASDVRDHAGDWCNPVQSGAYYGARWGVFLSNSSNCLVFLSNTRDLDMTAPGFRAWVGIGKALQGRHRPQRGSRLLQGLAGRLPLRSASPSRHRRQRARGWGWGKWLGPEASGRQRPDADGPVVGGRDNLVSVELHRPHACGAALTMVSSRSEHNGSTASNKRPETPKIKLNPSSTSSAA